MKNLTAVTAHHYSQEEEEEGGRIGAGLIVDGDPNTEPKLNPIRIFYGFMSLLVMVDTVGLLNLTYNAI